MLRGAIPKFEAGGDVGELVKVGHGARAGTRSEGVKRRRVAADFTRRDFFGEETNHETNWYKASKEVADSTPSREKGERVNRQVLDRHGEQKCVHED